MALVVLAAIAWPIIGVLCFFFALLWYLTERPDQIDAMTTVKRYLIVCLVISVFWTALNAFDVLPSIDSFWELVFIGPVLTWPAPAGLAAGWIIGHWMVLAWRLIRRQRPEE